MGRSQQSLILRSRRVHRPGGLSRNPLLEGRWTRKPCEAATESSITELAHPIARPERQEYWCGPCSPSASRSSARRAAACSSRADLGIPERFCTRYAVEKMNIASTVCEMRTQF